jgi:hypothetical protein
MQSSHGCVQVRVGGAAGRVAQPATSIAQATIARRDAFMRAA